MKTTELNFRGLDDPAVLALKGAARDSFFRCWIYARDNGRCGVCGKPVAFADLEIDHVIPRDLGGEDHIRNLQVTHMRCNRAKKNKLGELRPQTLPKQRRKPQVIEIEPVWDCTHVNVTALWNIMLYQGRTLRWLASRTNCDYLQICRWKRGLEPIPTGFAFDAAKAFPLPVEMLFSPIANASPEAIDTAAN